MEAEQKERHSCWTSELDLPSEDCRLLQDRRDAPNRLGVRAQTVQHKTNVLLESESAFTFLFSARR